LEGNIIEGLTVFKLPEHFRRRLRTSNTCEHINREIKRRTRVAGLFPNESSVLRLLTAILMETSDEWDTGRSYFSDPPQP
jgi:putative transposase